MPTLFNGWTVITIPSAPSAPANIEFSCFDAVAISISPFDGSQKVQNWGPLPMEASVSMPPMPMAIAENWITFLRALQGQANVFQFSAAFAAAYTSSIGTRYWRLKSNGRKWSVGNTRLFGISFDVREAK